MKLDVFTEHQGDTSPHANISSDFGYGSLQARTCSSCGWWLVYERVQYSSDYGRPRVHLYGCRGTLRSFSDVESEGAFEEIRSYLLAKYETRFQVNPRIFEEVVASVFRDLGYQARVTAYTKDGGVDVILADGSREIGVQVKRVKSTVGVSQIRELVGALMLGDYTDGVFVTTSSFTGPSRAAAAASAARALPVELVDAERFLQALEVARRPSNLSPRRLLAETSKRLELIDTDHVSG